MARPSPVRCQKIKSSAVSRETSFAEAKAPEQRIEEMFDTGDPRNTVDRSPRDPQFFGDQDGVA